MNKQIRKAATLEVARWRAQKWRADENRGLAILRAEERGYRQGQFEGELARIEEFSPGFKALIKDAMRDMCGEIARAYRPEFRAILLRVAEQVEHTPSIKLIGQNYSAHKVDVCRFQVRSEARNHCIDIPVYL